MTEGQKKLTIVLLVGIGILLLLTFGRRAGAVGDGQIIDNRSGSVFGDVYMPGVELPNFTYTPGEYPIPTLPDFAGIEDNLASACCASCDNRVDVPSYYVPVAPPVTPPPTLMVIQGPTYTGNQTYAPVTHVTRSSGATASFIEAPPESGYVNAAGNVTSGIWW